MTLAPPVKFLLVGAAGFVVYAIVGVVIVGLNAPVAFNKRWTFQLAAG